MQTNVGQESASVSVGLKKRLWRSTTRLSEHQMEATIKVASILDCWAPTVAEVTDPRPYGCLPGDASCAAVRGPQ